MSSLLKLRRGSTVSHSTFTGADGEVTFNTDTNQLVTHDGTTAGGFPHVKAADLVASGGASLMGYMPSGVGAVATDVQSKLRESVSFADFGCTGVGDETAKIQAALTYASANGKAIVDFSGKTFNYSSNLTVGAIELIGNFTLNGTGSAFLTISGTLIEIGYVSSAATKGDSSVVLSAVSGLTKNDLVILWNSIPYSYSIHRSNYYDGEFARVSGVSGSTVSLQSNLLTSYAGAATQKVFKSSGIRVVIDGPSFTGDGVFSVRIRYAANVEVSAKLISSSAFESALIINNCYNVRVNGGRYYTPYEVSGGGYGINIANSQFVYINKVDAFGGRHPVTTGGGAENGAVPCRYIYVENSVLTNDPASGVYAADFHGNTLDSYYKDCTIYGRIGLAGENVSAIDCKVHSWPNSNAGPLGMHEVVGGKIAFHGCTTFVGKDSIADWIVGTVASGLSAKISKPYQVDVRGLDATLNAAVTHLVNAFENSGQPNAWVLDDFGIRGTLSGLVNMVLFTKVAPGLDAYSINITNPTFGTSPYTLVGKSGTTLPSTKFLFPDTVGSGSNGFWTKFADGTMTCHHYLTPTDEISTAFLGGFRSGGVTWTYPQVFIATPEVSITPSNGSATGATISSKTTSACIFFGLATSTQTSAARAFSVTATGRWY